MRSIFFATLALTWVLCVTNAAAVQKSGKADLDHYSNYPSPLVDRLGRFAFIDGKQTKEWVKNNNIIALHEKNANQYKLKTFKITQGKHQITAKVYDMCSDKDCDGCCTKSSKKTGFLIQMEENTLRRFGSKGEGVVEWTCVDC